MNFSTAYAGEEREAGPEGWGLLFSSLSLFFIPYKQFSFQIMRYITILLTLLVALVIANFVEAEAADDSGGTDEPATVEPMPTLRVRSHAIRKHHKRGYPVGMLCASRTTWVSKNKQKIRGEIGGKFYSKPAPQWQESLSGLSRIFLTFFSNQKKISLKNSATVTQPTIIFPFFRCPPDSVLIYYRCCRYEAGQCCWYIRIWVMWVDIPTIWWQSSIFRVVFGALLLKAVLACFVSFFRCVCC